MSHKHYIFCQRNPPSYIDAWVVHTNLFARTLLVRLFGRIWCSREFCAAVTILAALPFLSPFLSPEVLMVLLKGPVIAWNFSCDKSSPQSCEVWIGDSKSWVGSFHRSNRTGKSVKPNGCRRWAAVMNVWTTMYWRTKYSWFHSWFHYYFQ